MKFLIIKKYLAWNKTNQRNNFLKKTKLLSQNSLIGLMYIKSYTSNF